MVPQELKESLKINCNFILILMFFFSCFDVIEIINVLFIIIFIILFFFNY
jgi:hypothetical protein